MLKILKFPDKNLKKKSKKIDQVTPDIKTFVHEMLNVMYETNGIGLAAPQVGRLERFLVIDTRTRDIDGRYNLETMTELEKKIEQPIVIFNPEIIRYENKTSYEEGCLSVPGFYEKVHRHQYVEVKGLNLESQQQIIKTDGLLSICLQHEIDHLDGKLFIDRISFLKANRIKNKIIKEGYEILQETAPSNPKENKL